MKYKRMAQLKNAEDFRAYIQSLHLDLPFDELVHTACDAPLAAKHEVYGVTLGNRFCILPMEGWDGTPDGRPTALTRRRWQRFGLSGAKLIWGGEAVAVRHDGRANPHQLLINEANLKDMESLRMLLVNTHAETYGDTRDLMVGLQLTHAGRFARPNDNTKLEPRILYHHPVLDKRFPIRDGAAVLTDEAIDALIGDFVQAAVLAWKAGFSFVDIKHCHGYLGHEFLSAVDRSGRYGGSFVNRTRFIREIISGIRAAAPGLHLGVRVSVFDWIPFTPGPDKRGVPEPCPEAPYRHAFGGDGKGTGMDLREPKRFLDLLWTLGVKLVCTTAGSPYYNPHIQRPALFPPSDGYQPPEDPLAGVARQIAATRALRRHKPEITMVGSGYSYLQEWLAHVGQYVVRTGGADFIGLGRMVLAYPDMPADILAGRPLKRKKICRTFSDCTTAPRNGMISGCFPLDAFYRRLPEAEALQGIKSAARP